MRQFQARTRVFWNIYGSFSKYVHIWGKIFSKKLIFAFYLVLRLIRRKYIYELRNSHIQA